MFKELRNGLMAGLGAVVLTRDRIEEISRNLVKEAKLSEEDARRLADDLVGSGEKQFNRLEKAVSDALRDGMENIGVGRKENVERLKHKMDAMEIRLGIVEKQLEACLDEQNRLARSREGK